MLTTIYILVLAGVILLPVLLLYFYGKKQKRMEDKNLLQQLHRQASAYNLSFGSQEMAERTVFGIDCINRKMLVVEIESDGEYGTTLIELDRVQTCSLQKCFAAGKETAFGSTVPLAVPSTISLLISLEEGRRFEIVFFSGRESRHKNLDLLEQKAMHWQIVVCKLASAPHKRA